MNKIRVLLADDHNIVRNGIRSLFEGVDDVEIVGEASDGLEAIEKVRELSPDVVMMDITMPNMTGIEAAEVIHRQFGNTKSLILSMHDNEDYILKSVEAGAHGYLLKDTTKEELLKALRAVAKGEKYFNSEVSSHIITGYLQRVKRSEEPIIAEERSNLSRMETKVLRYIVEGLSSREIADKLDLSIRTIDNHRANMMKKLQVKNAAELVKLAIEKKLV